MFNNMVLLANNCQNVYENRVIFKFFKKPQISSCQNKTLFNDSSILVLVKKAVLKWMGVSVFWVGQVEKCDFPRA